MEFKGITVGTYISRKSKNKNEKYICANCEINTKIQKSMYIDKEKEYELCKNCDKCYISKSCKALLTIGRDTTTGKTIRKTFGAETEEKKLVDYLMNISYAECSYKYLLLWQLTTGMRIGEALVLDYKKDIILSENKVKIRRTQTKDDKGNIIIGDTTKTDNGRRTLTMNNISMQIMEKALEHKIKNKDNLLFCKQDVPKLKLHQLY